MNKPEEALKAPAFPTTPVLLVDGDIVAYRAAAAAEKIHYLVSYMDPMTSHPPLCKLFDNAKDAKAEAKTLDAYYKDLGYTIAIHVWSRKEVQPESHAIQCLNATMEAIDRRFEGCPTQVFLSGERNFRDDVWRTKKYKGNRTAEKPKHLEAVRQALISRWNAVVSENQEADDDIGIASTESTVVVSTDKDLDQIPGWHYNWVNEELYYVGEADAEQFFWEQVISGDPVDNIPGLPDWGPAKARKYMDTCPDWDKPDHVLELFKQEGFDLAYMQEMMSLVRIKRA